jgi:phosphatidylserine/phosphatidylglycerophosphate/cardiolipin synthase-like enzyme
MGAVHRVHGQTGARITVKMRRRREKAVRLFGFLVLVFSILLGHTMTHALPAEDVRVVLDREYFQVTRGLLRSAKKSIQVMMFEAGFYVGHPKSPSNLLIGELISAQKRGIKVEVILEISDRGDRTTERNRRTGQMLSKEGVDVIYDPLFVTTHAKLLIIDGRISLLGSTNWTYYSLTRNHEVGVLIESEEVARTLRSYFDRVKTSGHR